jgi:tryptophan-rich sensory protein
MNILKLLGCILVSGLAGAIGAVFTSRSVTTWYVTIAKPSFTPPGWVFGPAWTVLYILMGIALYLVWERASIPGAVTPWAFALFFLQLTFNALWSVIFFGQRAIGLALVDIALLWLAVLATMLVFWQVSRVAGALLIPYLAWVTFAAALNYSIWRLNSGAV